GTVATKDGMSVSRGPSAEVAAAAPRPLRRRRRMPCRFFSLLFVWEMCGLDISTPKLLLMNDWYSSIGAFQPTLSIASRTMSTFDLPSDFLAISDSRVRVNVRIERLAAS